ncbi:methyl-accepting chemotaxis protein [Clostridium sp.]|uniref:methyl-accepting chemotaxis protein n=1 Tax=Clostridium sp. TaxID=1506 RepID=UPI00283CEFEB|nr:methyl-accepting chemotaxis protein [Clostridium sp.]MDR3595355.1 methyl-accepting chemotaxis protein [Clostridium sp.]
MKFKLKNTIFTRLVFAFTSIILITLLCLGVTSFINVKNTMEKNVISSTSEILEQNKNYVDYIAETVNNYSIQLLTNSELRKVLTTDYKEKQKDEIITDASKILSGIMVSNSLVESTYIINPDGVTIGYPMISINASQLSKVKDSEFYKKAIELNGKGFWIPPHYDEFSPDKTTLFVSNVRLLKDLNGDKIAGVLVMNIKAAEFQKALDNAKIGDSGFMYILDQDNIVMSHPKQDLLGKSLDNQELVNKMAKDSTGNFVYNDASSKRDVLTVHAVSETTNWKYVAEIPYSEISSSANNIRNIIIIISIICFILTILVSIKISHSISKPIKNLMDAMKKVGDGYLNLKLKTGSDDEIGQLNASFNIMVSKVNILALQVKDASGHIQEHSKELSLVSQNMEASSKEVSFAIRDITEGVAAQAEDLLHISHLVGEFTGNLESIFTSIKDAVYNASRIEVMATNSNETLKTLATSINNINVSFEKVKDKVDILKVNVNKITEITNLINSIAEQTNLLALNAAIEAARAGEAGKGFAVVAAEIRKLAEQSKASSENISNLIMTISKENEATIETTEYASKELNMQIMVINNSIDSFKEIVNAVSVIVPQIENIDVSTNQINSQKNEIMEKVDSTSTVAQEISATSEEIFASAEQISNFSSEVASSALKQNEKVKNMIEEVSKFKNT